MLLQETQVLSFYIFFWNSLSCGAKLPRIRILRDLVIQGLSDPVTQWLSKLVNQWLCDLVT